MIKFFDIVRHATHHKYADVTKTTNEYFKRQITKLKKIIRKLKKVTRKTKDMIVKIIEQR